jgi:hypothetical protein
MIQKHSLVLFPNYSQQVEYKVVYPPEVSWYEGRATIRFEHSPHIPARYTYIRPNVRVHMKNWNNGCSTIMALWPSSTSTFSLYALHPSLSSIPKGPNHTPLMT